MNQAPIEGRIEMWFFHGLPPVPLTPEQRAEIVEYALSLIRADWEARGDRGLVNGAWLAMAARREKARSE